MKKNLILLLLLPGFLSCSSNRDEAVSNKFDPQKWAVQEGKDFPYRDVMLDDLMKAFKWKGMKQDSVLILLGRPGRTDNNHLFYLVAQKRLGFFPLHTKSLVIKLDSTDRVIWLKIHK